MALLVKRYKQYTEQQKTDALEALRTNLSYLEISELTGLSYQTIYNLNYEHRIRPVKPKPHKKRIVSPSTAPKPTTPKPVVVSTSLKVLEEQQRELMDKVKVVMAEVDEITKKIASHRISFTKDAQGFVTITGLAEQPLTAHYQDWLRFFSEGQGAKLREFVSDVAKDLNGVQPTK